ncbi:MAG: iron-sulfur cluster assembly scaffold protein [Thermodesulfobacteriota bacterium]|nr:iron-sulfur cluster assembly scaffold protein [Thermodesulfobacteriota bacterium]
MVTELDKTLDELQDAIIRDARKIYSEKVIERWLHPRNIGEIANCDGFGKITGSCGDTMWISLKVKDDEIIDIKFMTDGCGTSLAAGSMVTELAMGKKVREAFKISQEVILENLDGLPEESIHCALLASNVLREALRDYVSTKNEPWKKTYKR